MLKKKFKTLCQNYTENKEIIELLWQNIESKYSNNNRYYHTLEHLEHIYKELEKVKLNHILEFSIFYHDIIYDVKKINNEEQSAKLAINEIKKLNISEDIRTAVAQLILETNTHQATSEQNRLFLDADLAILGSEPIKYKSYIQKIRKEYVVYTDSIYMKGRIKVIEMFLEQDKIYKSEYFYKLYEEKAKFNLSKEYEVLNR